MKEGERHSFGHQPAFKRLLSQARAVQHTSRTRRDLEAARVAERDQPWVEYTRNVRDYISYLAKRGFPDIEKKIRSKIEEKKRRGERMLVVDLAGAASAAPLDPQANIETLSTTLRKEFPRGSHGRPVRIEAEQGQKIIEGDLLTYETQQTFMQSVEASGLPISCAFFVPLMGTVGYENNAYAYRKMSRLFKDVYARLEPGGELYIDLKYVPWLNIPSLRDMQNVFAGTSARVEQPTLYGLLKTSVFRVTRPV